MNDAEPLDWRAEFTSTEYEHLRVAFPKAIYSCQDRSARAHTEYGDPDGHQYLYGNGMARGVQKDLLPLIKDLDSFREETVPGTHRSLLFVRNSLLFPLRVGKQMPRNHHKVRLTYLPDTRRELLHSTSNAKYREPGLFDVPKSQAPDDDVAQISDVLRMLGNFDGPVTLFPIYYSSTPLTVGNMYWGPARLNGHYLEFTNPERLTYLKVPASAKPQATKPRAAGGFASGERPRTQAKLRPRPEDEKGNS